MKQVSPAAGKPAKSRVYKVRMVRTNLAPEVCHPAHWRDDGLGDACNDAARIEARLQHAASQLIL